MNTIPNDLLDIESELRSLRPNVPRLILLRPVSRRYPLWIIAPLLFGLLIGGVSVGWLRPVAEPMEIVRVIEVPVFVAQAPATQSQPLSASVRRPPSAVSTPTLDLDAMLETYSRRAQFFAGIKWNSVISSSSNGSISDPMSIFKIRETLNL